MKNAYLKKNLFLKITGVLTLIILVYLKYWQFSSKCISGDEGWGFGMVMSLAMPFFLIHLAVTLLRLKRLSKIDIILSLIDVALAVMIIIGVVQNCNQR